MTLAASPAGTGTRHCSACLRLMTVVKSSRAGRQGAIALGFSGTAGHVRIGPNGIGTSPADPSAVDTVGYGTGAVGPEGGAVAPGAAAGIRPAAPGAPAPAAPVASAAEAAPTPRKPNVLGMMGSLVGKK